MSPDFAFCYYFINLNFINYKKIPQSQEMFAELFIGTLCRAGFKMTYNKKTSKFFIFICLTE
jgi:hypothetical protein